MYKHSLLSLIGAATPPPANTVLPSISAAGQVLSTTDGTWTGTGLVYTYQWKRGGASIGGAAANQYTLTSADIGATITVTVTATNSGGQASATSAGYSLTYTQKTNTLSPIAYWTQGEPSGTTITDSSGNSRTGTYTNVTLGATGIGDGTTAATYVPGSTSRANVYSAGLAGVFGSAEGSFACWVIVSGAGVWTDGQNRRIATFQADASNNVIITKTSGNILSWSYVAGGTTKSRTKTVTPTVYFHMALTWSKSNDRVIAYYNGVQEGATLTGLGTWAGSLASTTTVLASSTASGAFIWDGSLAHAALFATELSAANIAALATVP